MAFVSEYASEIDAKKYDLDGVSLYFGKDPSVRYSWTIDRGRDVFLMWISSGREEFANKHRFVFWWRGEMLTIYLEGKGEGRPSERSSKTWSLPGLDLPCHLESERHEIIAALKEALKEYKVSGVGVPVANHTTFFNF